MHNVHFNASVFSVRDVIILNDLHNGFDNALFFQLKVVRAFKCTLEEANSYDQQKLQLWQQRRLRLRTSLSHPRPLSADSINDPHASIQNSQQDLLSANSTRSPIYNHSYQNQHLFQQHHHKLSPLNISRLKETRSLSAEFS